MPSDRRIHAMIEPLTQEERAERDAAASSADPANRIPIAAARRIAEEYGQQQVILVTWDGANTHVVTYGTTLEACDQAAQGGNRVKRSLGWPEDLCQDTPARVRRRARGVE